MGESKPNLITQQKLHVTQNVPLLCRLYNVFLNNSFSTQIRAATKTISWLLHFSFDFFSIFFFLLIRRNSFFFHYSFSPQYQMQNKALRLSKSLLKKRHCPYRTQCERIGRQPFQFGWNFDKLKVVHKKGQIKNKIIHFPFWTLIHKTHQPVSTQVD